VLTFAPAVLLVLTHPTALTPNAVWADVLGVWGLDVHFVGWGSSAFVRFNAFASALSEAVAAAGPAGIADETQEPKTRMMPMRRIDIAFPSL
jgi:hypothetical protein